MKACIRQMTTGPGKPTDAPRFIYDIDDRPPLKYFLLYGLQWSIIHFPALIIVAVLSSSVLDVGLNEEARLLQLILLATGLFTAVQSLWGHRYPLLEGPSTALLLTYLLLAPLGIEAVQGGTIIGGVLLICLVMSRKLKNVAAFATPNVVGVILLLIAFSLLPFLARLMSGIGSDSPQGDVSVFLFSVLLVLVMAGISSRASGVVKTLALLIGMAFGTLVLFLIRSPGLKHLAGAAWISLPDRPFASVPEFYWPAMLAFALSYVAVLVNSLGSLHGIAGVTDRERLPSATSRGIFFNGVAGILCGCLGIVGMVSYSISPGVVLANRVASRYATACCGVILVVAAFVPKLSALLALIPPPVVGAALCVAMGTQVGAAVGIIASKGMKGRDYFVVGLPVLLGTLVGFLPDTFMDSLPVGARVFLRNGLIFGILLVLLLEHVLMREKRTKKGDL